VACGTIASVPFTLLLIDFRATVTSLVASIAARDFVRLQSLWLAAPDGVLEAYNGMTPRVFGSDSAFLIRSSTYQQRSSLTERSWTVVCPADRLERCKGTAILQAAPAVLNFSMPECVIDLVKGIRRRS
jgi:hypothetical protein